MSDISDQRLAELRARHLTPVLSTPRPTIEQLEKLLARTDDVHVQLMPNGEVRATQSSDSDLIVKIIDELQRLRSNAWQPIETAPDDEDVLVWVVSDTHKTTSTQIGYKDVAGSQYWWITPSGAAIEIYDYRATHWQPLPAPPSYAAAEPKEPRP